MANKIIELYSQDATRSLKRVFPELSEEDLKNRIANIAEISYQEIDCEFYNNYNLKEESVSLSRFVNFVKGKNKPIFTGYGVCFQQHEKVINLFSKLLEYLGDMRKIAKKEKFKYGQEGNKAMKELKDLVQKTFKLIANSFYGITGEKRSFAFNRFYAPSITYTGVQIITTAILNFEAFLGNNFQIKNFSELLTFIGNVIETEITDDCIIDFSREISSTDVINRLAEQMQVPLKPDQMVILENIVNELDWIQQYKLYYKNNLYQLMEDSPTINTLLNYIVKTIEENSDTVKFYDANEPPEAIMEALDSIWNIIGQWVFYNFNLIDRYDRAENMERKAVIVCDTDSNFLNIDPSMNKLAEIYEKANGSHLNLENEDLKIAIINTFTWFLNKVIREAFDKLTAAMNVNEQYQPIIAMKNEFIYPRIMLTDNKKQYAGLIRVQEGNILDPMDFDMKGLSIKKTTVNKTSRGKFAKFLKEDILESNDIGIAKILREYRQMEAEIRASILSGSVEYAIPKNVNKINSYKEPLTQQQVRGSLIWNKLYPNNTIEFPNKVNLWKLDVSDYKDLVIKLQDVDIDNDMIDTINDFIFEDPTMAHYGFKVIALPKPLKETPQWLIPLIDIDTIVSDNISNGLVLLKSLGINVLKTPRGEYYSNIVEI